MNIRPSSRRSPRLRRLALVVGLMLAAAGMGTAQAASAPDPVKPRTTGSVEHTGPVPGGYASWKDLLLDQQKMVRAADRITAALPGDGGGYAGLVAAPESRELRVYWKGRPPKAIDDLVGRLRREVAISVLPARYSARELEGEANRLIRANRDLITSIEPLQDGSGLNATTASAGATRTAISGAAVPVSVEPGVRPKVASRWDDSPPWWGGSVWGTPSPACTTGFAVTYQGVSKMLSSAHCASVGQTAADPTGQVIGTVTHSNASRDVLLIGTSAGSQVFNNPVNSVATEFNNAVIGTTSSVVGQYVCTSGGFSGTNCTIRITAVNVTINVGWLIQGTVRAEQQSFTNAAGGGDSGGPVEVTNPSNTNQVYAAGIITATDYGTQVPCTGYRPTGRVCTWRIYYSPWSNATTAFPGITLP
ncbi:chymotrypsin family serine protease [Sphaerisporangium rhizosphaerae]|uniref:Streptogrisin C n=1 Tax=Sphaerisporangium rhizosphaerae TaxID=2269375 RepID=A0ABW2PFH1_9ACTN